MLTARRAKNSDCDALSGICFRSKQSNGYDVDFMEACRDALCVTPQVLETSDVWLIEQAGRSVACGALNTDQMENTAEISLFFVDPSAQRSGVGRMLAASLLRTAAERGAKIVALDADPNAVPFYQILGFEIIGETPSDIFPDRKLPKMRKLL